MAFNALIIIALVCAVGCFVVLLSLRAYLMVVFPSQVVRRLPGHTQPQMATADLYEKAAAELTALGFSPPQWAVVAPEKETPGSFAVLAAFFCHAEKNTLVELYPPLNPSLPNELTTQFVTRLADGRRLTSQVNNFISKAIADDEHPAQTITGATLAEQWAKHRHWVEGFKTPAAPNFGAPETLPEELQTMVGSDARLVGAGKLWRDAQGVARPTLRFAFRLLWLSWTQPRRKKKKEKVPLARQVMLAAFFENLLKLSLPVRWQWLFLLLWCALFFVAFGVFRSLALAPVILGVIILHEGAHYLTLRALGFRRVQMLGPPLVCSVSVNSRENPSATRLAWAAMMGPLPSIVLGWMLLIFAIISNADSENAMFFAAIVLLTFNYILLLPIPSVDGSQIVQALLPLRWRIVQTVLIVVIYLAAAVITASCFHFYFLAVLLLLFPLLLTPSRLVCHRAERLLAADASFAGASPDQQRKRVLETLQQCAGDPANMASRLRQAFAVTAALKQTPLSRQHRIALMALYLVLLCLPLIFWTLISMKVTPPSVIPPRIDPEVKKQTQQRVFLSLGGMSVPQLLLRMPPPEHVLPLRSRWGWFEQFQKPASPPPLPAPADPEQIVEAQKRLNMIFPDDYRELLSRYDGYPRLQLLPVAQVRRLSETTFFSEQDIKSPYPFYSFAFPPSSFDATNTETVPGQRAWSGEALQNCAVISGWDIPERDKTGAKITETYPALLWCPGPEFEQARIVSLDEALWAPDFTTYLRYKIMQGIAYRELTGNATGDNSADQP